MKVKQKNPAQVISISDRTVDVIRIENDTIIFRAFVDVEATAALEYNVNLCQFRVFSSADQRIDKPKLSSIESSDVMQSATLRKVKAIRRYTNTMARGAIDITKSMPNDRVSSILRGKPVRLSKIINFDSSDDASSQIKSVDSASANSDSGSNDFIVSYCNDLVNRNHIDPASVFNDAPFHSSIPRVSRGMRTSGLMSKLDPKDLKFRNSYVDDKRKKLNVRFDTVEESVIEVPFTFKVSRRFIGTYQVEIDAVSSSRSTSKIQTIKFSVDLRKAYENYIIPTLSPSLQITNVGSSRFIRIKQRDLNATSVRIYRRSYSEKKSSNFSHFTEVASISVKPGDEAQFVDRPDVSGRCLYRVVPFNDLSLTSGEFSSAVVPGARSRETKSHKDTTTLLAVEREGQIGVSIFNVPNDVISVRLVRRNLTIFETSLSSPTSVVDGPIRILSRSNRNVDFQDYASRPDTAYEYKVMMIDVFGDERESEKNAIVYFVGNPEVQEGRTIIVQSPKITDNQGPKVTFQINAPTEQSTLDNIYNILINQGLSQQYVDEIKQNRELFGKIVAFEMLRFDTTSGQNESFGVIKEGTFEDSLKTRSMSNVSSLKAGRKYIYNYRLLVRSPSTLFDTATVSRIDLETGRTFSTNLKKFNAPRALTRGTLTSTAVQQRTFSKTGLKVDPTRLGIEELMAGRTSLTGTTEVRIPEVSTSVSNLSVEQTSRGNVIRWRIKEGIQEIDHIIIFADYNGRLAPLRALQYCGNNNMMYLDNHLSASTNEAAYYVRLVFLDFQQGELVGPAKVEENAS